VYVDTPAHLAGIPPNSIIKEVNGVLISDRAGVTAVLDATVPGDRIPVIVEHKGVATEYQLTLAAWPAEMSDRTSGFMGVSYYDAPLVKEQFGLLSTPLGVIILLATPIYTIMEPVSWGHFGLLTIDSVDSTMWEVPFAGFWFVIQLLFWCGWFNFVVGTFNALPLIPLDGGYILKEGVERLMDRRGWLQYAGSVVSAISYGMLAILLAVVILPILLNWKW
jgi:membrane-associated protease RseP (regulator of RpoE activity)